MKDLDDWMLARNALHLEIDDAFREAGIEIAFPQRDIHIRSIEPVVKLAQSGGAATEPPTGETKREVPEQPR